MFRKPRNRLFQIVNASGLLLLLWGCSARPAPVVVYPADPQSALDDQAREAEHRDRDQALDQVRLASMAIAQGRLDLAEQALRGAVATMTDFRADGEFAAAVGAESNKEWKGEPYEKMAAYLTLGALLHRKGDRGNALAMYKSAILADTGTAAQRYRSDFVPAWILQALAYQAEGERENARQSMTRGVDARWSRHLIDLLTDELSRVDVPQRSDEDVYRAEAVILAALSAGATAAPRNPDDAARATVSYASDLILAQQKLPDGQRLPTLQGFSKSDFQRAADTLPAVAASWKRRVAQIPSQSFTEQQLFADMMEGLLDEPPNVILLIEQGRGPRKYRAGRYGEVLQLSPGDRVSPPRVAIDGRRSRIVQLDSMTYQATTRGGRKVDGFLRGKAVKDASTITGAVLLEMAEVAARRDNEEEAAALCIAGGLLYLSGIFTNPSADIRQWEMLPEGYFLAAATVEPGDHALLIAQREYTLVVPPRGQVVAVVPELAPGGAKIIRME
ncbi:MAG: hypothetical protein AAFV53_29395 [Myxococcota bacterium]